MKSPDSILGTGDLGKCKLHPFLFTSCRRPHFHEGTLKYLSINIVAVAVLNKESHVAKAIVSMLTFFWKKQSIGIFPWEP